MAGPDHERDDTYSEAETVARREAALKRALATPRTSDMSLWGRIESSLSRNSDDERYRPKP